MKQEIAKTIYKIIEKSFNVAQMTNDYRKYSEDLKQDIMLVVLETINKKGDAYIQDMIDSKEINYFILKIVKNQISKKGDFVKKYINHGMPYKFGKDMISFLSAEDNIDNY